MEDLSERLTICLSAVSPRDQERSSFLAADQCADAYLSAKAFFMQACPGKAKDHALGI